MLLPTKHITTRYSLLGVGTSLLRHMERPRTVTTLWEKAREIPEVGTFERFSLALVFLYSIGALEIHDDLLRRVQR